MAVNAKSSVFTKSVTFDGNSIETAYGADVSCIVTRTRIKAGDSQGHDAAPIVDVLWNISILCYESNQNPTGLDANIFTTDGIADLVYVLEASDATPSTVTVTFTNAEFLGFSDGGAAQGSPSFRRYNFQCPSAPAYV